ncbi:MAG: hypothetical protein JEZ04_21790 [Spirochaetales bacterium]|nr:hypothetical protein [Spirochaetales bacterium]
MKKRTFHPSTLVIFIFIWTIINLLFLSVFPFMHTDEAWLAGLSRTMMLEKNPGVTETFFDISRRAPHAIKLLYHLLQIIFIKTAGYSLFSVRLLSLFGGASALLTFGGLLKKLSLPPLGGTILLSLEVQFLYASHFGRQEILILLLMLISLNALYMKKYQGLIRGLLCGLPIALAVGFHPNAFIAAWPSGLLLAGLIIRKKRRLSEGLGFILTASAGAGVFILLSFLFNRAFAADYTSFGSKVGALNPLDVKLLGFDDFYRKLFLRISGTYYTPNIIPLFIAAAAGTVCSALLSIRSKTIPKTMIFALTGIAAVNAGIILIGKYSAPSVVFLTPFMVILICGGIERTGRMHRRALYAAAASVLLLNSSLMIAEELRGGRETHAQYTEKIAEAIPRNAMTLGGLTAGFYFEDGKLLDWRNLALLNEAGVTLEEYIGGNDIEYIIYSDEIDYIYKNRPVWNILYGNPVVYYEPLQVFLEEKCRLISEFPSPGYGTRLVMHRFKKNWKVRIYRLK